MMTTSRTLTPIDLLDAGLHSPAICAVLALILATALALLASGRRTRAASSATGLSIARAHAVEHRGIAVVAGAVVVAFLTEFLTRGDLASGVELRWWRFAVPLTVAAGGLVIVAAFIARRRMPRVAAPMPPTARRTWRSFSSASSLWFTAGAIGMLVATTVGAGAASSIDDEGRYARLTIPIPNAPDVPALQFPFYGWAYGVPVLVCLSSATAVLVAVLHLNSARRFQSVQSMPAESILRRRTARDSATLVAATVVLTTAEAWRKIADAGSASSLTVGSPTGEATYETPWRFAELAVAAGWLAPLLEVAALTILLLLVSGGVQTRRRAIAQVAPLSHPLGSMR